MFPPEKCEIEPIIPEEAVISTSPANTLPLLWVELIINVVSGVPPPPAPPTRPTIPPAIPEGSAFTVPLLMHPDTLLSESFKSPSSPAAWPTIPPIPFADSVVISPLFDDLRLV